MTHDRKLIFYIDAYSPETIPLAKLGEYIADFALLLGKDNVVHFAGLEPGSTRITAHVKFEDVPKVTTRLNDIRRGNPPQDAVKLFAQIDARLANDNAVGRILIEEDDAVAAELLVFPGRDRKTTQSYGPFTQDGSLDGILISVGGKDETVPLRLQNGDVTYTNCDTSRAIARDLGKHLFEPIRVFGTGRWIRESDGAWTVKRFRVRRFDLLSDASLRDTITALRAVRGSGWAEIADPLGELTDLRHDDDKLH